MDFGRGERDIERDFDRELNQQKDTRRVEWLAVILVVGALSFVFLLLAQGVVARARQAAFYAGARAARVTVQAAAMQVWDQLAPARDGAVNYTLAVDPAGDDANGALIRRAIGGAVPGISGAHLKINNLDETLDALAEGADTAAHMVLAARQQDGVFTLDYWESEQSYWQHPDKPDCTYTASGGKDANNAGRQGAYT